MTTAPGREAPRVVVPREYNAAVDLIERNLKAGRAEKIAFHDGQASLAYGALPERVDRCANALTALGLEPEQRVLLILLDTIDFPVAFLGAIKAGIVPVPVNTLLTPADYDFMLRDSRARALIVSDALYDKVEGVLAGQPALRHVIVAGANAHGHARFGDLLAKAEPRANAAPTNADDICFWLYS